MITCYVTADEAATNIRTFRGTVAASAFDALAVDDKMAAIMGAQLAFERLSYRGRKSDPTQKEAFPRVIDGTDVGIPEALKVALSLQVASRLSSGGEGASLNALQGAGVSNYSIADFSVGFDSASMAAARSRHGLTEDAYSLIAPYLLKGGPVYVSE